MSHFHKSWGAEPSGNGVWKFRLWAPGARGVDLVLDGVRHGMDRTAEGWFETEQEAAAGAAYGFAPDGGEVRPDPAARAQVDSVHGPSLLVDPEFAWQTEWKGRPWEETVLYELHAGTFSPSGDFDGIRNKLDHLAKLGITAIELCPVAHFAGSRGWGYDGVLLYAPHPAYGRPDDLKRLVDAAHQRGLMVFLDVVYNHFGPEGNYLPAYAPEFFHPERHTPWGAAIAFERDPVRRFFIENALYWLEEYRIDGLRLDAVDQIDDQSEEPILIELASAVRAHGFDRPVHLCTEDDRNVTFLLERGDDGGTPLYNGEWNDDFHHVAHVLATRESEGYYFDFAQDARAEMMSALAEGYVQQGQPSPFRGGKRRGEPSGHLPPAAFINFIQNHDQTGNRAFGDRLTTLAEPAAIEVLSALLLLNPMIPLLFMGEEWGETRPFQFFCDFEGDLAEAVRVGRRNEFGAWPQFADPELRETIPDPNEPATFERSCLDWNAIETPAGRERMDMIRALLAIRQGEIAPRLEGMASMNASAAAHGERGLEAMWILGDGSRLAMLANLGGKPFPARIGGRALYTNGDVSENRWAIAVRLDTATP